MVPNLRKFVKRQVCQKRVMSCRRLFRMRFQGKHFSMILSPNPVLTPLKSASRGNACRKCWFDLPKSSFGMVKYHVARIYCICNNHHAVIAIAIWIWYDACYKCNLDPYGHQKGRTNQTFRMRFTGKHFSRSWVLLFGLEFSLKSASPGDISEKAVWRCRPFKIFVSGA